MTEPIARRAANARVQNLPKQPPHSIEAEQCVLGGLMLDNRPWLDLADKLQPDQFYRTDHQVIYTAICELIGNNKACDFLTVTEWLRERGRLDEAGGASYIGLLASENYSVANIQSYAEIVRERSVLRALIAAGSDITDLGYRPDGRPQDELVGEAEQLVFDIRDRGAQGRKQWEDVGSVMKRVEARIEALRSNPHALAGLSTGFTELDRRTHGFHPGDLVIVAARPGMGKTTLAMNIAEHVAIVDKKGVAVFSMEMSPDQLTQRIVASFGRIELSKLRSGNLDAADYDRLTSAHSLLHEAPLYIDETSGLSPMDLAARARRLVSRHNIKLLVVDYLQLMQVPNTRENRTNEVSQITRSLKSLARELKIPIIALSQLSRANEKDNRPPKLSDLRDSGSIEQDADMVLFIYREDVTSEEIAARTTAKIIIGKHRSGPTGQFELTFLGQFTKFDNPADQSFGGT